MALSDVEWHLFLGPDSPIPHDVEIYSVQNATNTADCIKAHKFVLGAVSAVFRKIFFSKTLPDEHAGRDWVLTEDSNNNITKVGLHSCPQAIRRMVQFVYNAADDFDLFPPAQILTQMLPHIFETLQLARILEITKLETLLDSKLASLPINPGNVQAVINSTSTYAKLCQSPSSLLFRCLNLSYNQVVLRALVQVGRESANSLLVSGALTRLKCRVTEQNLWGLARLAEEFVHDAPEIMEAAEALRVRCLEKVAELMKFPKKFARVTAELNAEDESSYKKLFKLLDKMFCENCESVNCKNGELVDDDVKEGANVKLNEEEIGKVGKKESRKRIKLEVKSEEGSSAEKAAEEKLLFRIHLHDGSVKHCDQVYYDCK